jgi:hypothetical protein
LQAHAAALSARERGPPLSKDIEDIDKEGDWAAEEGEADDTPAKRGRVGKFGKERKKEGK